MKKNNHSKTAFFNPRTFTAFALCFFSVLLALLAFKPGTESPTVGNPSKDMPTLGEDTHDEAVNLSRMEQFWNDRLTYPTGVFNPAWVRAAAHQHLSMPKSLPAGSFARLNRPTKLTRASGINGRNVPLTLSTSGFTSLGPSPEIMTGCSGCYNYTKTQARVNAVAIDPTTVANGNGNITAYLGSVGGGVWKTTSCCTTSTTWTETTDDPLIGTTAIDTVTIDPNNHNTVYAGTGDLNYGSFSMGSQGILKSTDGGNTWSVLGSSIFGPAYNEPAGNYPQYASVGKVRVDPNNSNNVAAGTKSGLYLSHDGGSTWTQCSTNAFTTQRQDITGLELTDMGGGVTRVLAAVGVRGFPTYVQYDLGANGANGLYSANMTASGCPTFSSIASNANGFVFGTAVTGSPYATGANMNAGSGTPCNYPISGGTATYCGGASPADGGPNNLGRIDIAVAPSDPNTIYAQVQSIDWNNDSGCGNTNGCELGIWYTTNGGTNWTFLAGSAGGSLKACTGNAGAGDYPQNWYDQGMAIDPSDPTRVFIDTFDTFFATQSGTSLYDITCGYTYSGSSGPVHVDQHAIAFAPGSSDILLKGSDGGIFASTNASTTNSATRPTWVNMDTNLDTIEFYAGDISGNFANDSAPSAVGGAQDNGPSSVTFSGSPTGPASWQMGLGGDGFSGQIAPTGQQQSQAQGSITVSGAGTAGQTFVIGPQTFTWVTTRTSTGQVQIGSGGNPTNSAATNIRTAINADLVGTVFAGGSGATVLVTATQPGAAGNSITFTNNNSSNLTFNGTGTLGGTTQGGVAGSTSPVFYEGNNSGGFARCLTNCTVGGASWSSIRGAWTGDTQSFVLPVNLFRGGISGGDDCPNGCGHLLAATTRVWETINGASTAVNWYVTNNPQNANLTKQSIGNRSYINQVKYSPKFQSVAIVGTNDGNVQIGFNLGTGLPAQANWVNVTGSNVVLPNRPINGIALDPSVSAAAVPVGYAAVGGFNANTPSTPGHVFQVTCTSNCGSYTWANKTGNLPDIPVDSVIVNPNYPQQVFAGTDFGLYFTNDVTQASPTWQRFESGLPHAMIWDMSIDRGSTALSLWTRGRGAYVYPLPAGNIATPALTLTDAVSRMVHGSAGTFDIDLSSGNAVEDRSQGAPNNYTLVFTFSNIITGVDSVTPSCGSVASAGPGTDEHQYVVQLTGVTCNGQFVTTTLSGVHDSSNQTLSSVSATMGLLLGDTNADGAVNSADIGQTKSQSGQTVTNLNFREDVNADGFINSADIGLVKSQSGTALP